MHHKNCNDIEEYIKGNVKEIYSIDPGYENRSDLSSLKQAIGNSKIVMLGEIDHGDALTFSAKTRIIKYLHEDLGFNVILFESDFFGLSRIAQTKGSNWDIEEIKENIYPIWTACSSFDPMLDYLHKNRKSMRLADLMRGMPWHTRKIIFIMIFKKY